MVLFGLLEVVRHLKYALGVLNFDDVFLVQMWFAHINYLAWMARETCWNRGQVDSCMQTVCGC